MKKLGVRLAIHDFGTGYSSLTFLWQLPFDVMEIDGSLTTGILQSSESAALVHALIQLGKALGLETVAEGIEHEGQLERLRLEDCDTGQGFLVSRPIPASDVAALFSRALRPAGSSLPGTSSTATCGRTRR